MRFYWIRVGPKSNDRCPSKKGKGERAQRDTERREPCEDRGRDWSDSATSHGVPRNAAGPPEARKGYSLEPSVGARPCQLPDFRLLALGLREYISVVLNVQSVAICYSIPRKRVVWKQI